MANTRVQHSALDGVDNIGSLRAQTCRHFGGGAISQGCLRDRAADRAGVFAAMSGIKYDRGPLPGRSANVPHRPAFDRPDLIAAPATIHTGSPGHGVRLALAPVPAPLHTRLRTASRSKLAMIGAGTAVVTLVLVLAVFQQWHRVNRQSMAAPFAPATAAPIASATAVAPIATARAVATAEPIAPTSGRSRQPVLDADGAVRALDQLDALRERAFATDAPQLLAKVYQPGTLLAQDTALLTGMIRPGCGLIGVHTVYSAVRVVAAVAAHPVVLASATLSPSRLVCGQTQAGTALGQGPTTLRIALSLVGDGYRIAGQQPI